MAVAAQILAQMLNSDTTDHSGPSITCPCCNGTAHYAGRREKTFQTSLGDMSLMRAYFLCDTCQTGVFPRDRAMGIADTTLSPHLKRIIGVAASMVSFKDSEMLLDELAGLAVDAKQIERTAETLGHEISTYERTVVEAGVPCASTMYLGMDGTGLSMRKSELEGRQGKQPDGSSKTREVKLVTSWSASKMDKDGIAVRDEGSVTYSAAIESAASRDTDKVPSEFACRVEREALRRGFDKAKRCVILGDGAKWIWNLADVHFPDALQIVDLYHAKGTISEAAKAVFGPTSDLGKQWAKQRRDELEEGELDKVIAAFNIHALSCEEAQTCCNYLERNRARLNYPLFRSHRLCTSSGVVEAGCKHAVGERLKQAGMHWTVTGADAIIALRCCRLSGRYEDFWEWKMAS
jgi:hypothetical protein